MLDFNAKSVINEIKALPDAPSETVSDKYSFIDTKTVVNDMIDLGYSVTKFERPKFRTKAGAYGVHQVEFMKKDEAHCEAGTKPRMVFLNSYDGSRRAQILTGVFRFVCSNGLIIGTTLQKDKFLHLGDYDDQLINRVRETAAESDKLIKRIADLDKIELTREQALELADRAVKLRFGGDDSTFTIRPEHALLVRRQEDTRRTLWTQWNVLQENLLQGGVPSFDENGRMRAARRVTQILKANKLNQDLWDLLEETAAAA